MRSAAPDGTGTSAVDGWDELAAGRKAEAIAARIIEECVTFNLAAVSDVPLGTLVQSTEITVTIEDGLADTGCGGGGYYRPSPPTIHLHPATYRRDNFTLLHELGHHLQQWHDQWGFALIDMADRDTKGDLYEYMLGKIATAGENGQFRTPRHIIKLMVDMTVPMPKDVICDPACGTAGFLIAAIVWMMPSSEGSEFWVILFITYVIALGDFAHVVVGSAELFIVALSGEESIFKLVVMNLLPALAGNIIGGAGLFAILAWGQVHEEIDEDSSQG